MAQQLNTTITRPAPHHRDTRRPDTRRPGTRRPGTRRPAGGPRVQRVDRERGFEARGVSAGCRVQRPLAGRAGAARAAGEGELRLTDRGIAAVLVLGALLGLAAMLCIGVTAARVTAEPAPQAAVTATEAAPASGVAAGPRG